MSQPYVGEIRIFAGNFAPNGWLLCDGSTVPISENETLFQLIGTTYGGDGETYFNLPDLRGRTPIHQGTSTEGITAVLGQTAGVEEIVLTTQQIPKHTHTPVATRTPTSANPSGRVWSAWSDDPYSPSKPTHLMRNDAIRPEGGSQAHNNMPPYLALNFIISMYGIFPSQT